MPITFFLIKTNKQTYTKVPSFVLSIRFMTAVLLFLGYCFQYMAKINLSIGIVCMVNNTALLLHSTHVVLSNSSHVENTTALASSCSSTDSAKGHHMDGPFAWEKNVQGLVLASYFYGYIVSQVDPDVFRICLNKKSSDFLVFFWALN